MPRRILIGLVAAAVLPAGATGQDSVRRQPELVAPGVISTPAIDPRDGSLWFSRYERNFDQQTIYRAGVQGDGWATPVMAPFSGTYGDRAPRFSPDGSRLYVTSNRPLEGRGPPGDDLNIWVATRRADGGWDAPTLVPAPVSLPASRDMHATITADSSLFFASYRPEGRGQADIFLAPWRNARFGTAEPLDSTVNDSLGQTDLFVSPDGTYMVVTDRPGGLGGDDLYLLAREGTGWTRPVHLPAPINSEEYEYGPAFSPDGRWLYFTSHRGGSGDIYRVEWAIRIW